MTRTVHPPWTFHLPAFPSLLQRDVGEARHNRWGLRLRASTSSGTAQQHPQFPTVRGKAGNPAKWFCLKALGGGLLVKGPPARTEWQVGSQRRSCRTGTAVAPGGPGPGHRVPAPAGRRGQRLLQADDGAAPVAAPPPPPFHPSPNPHPCPLPFRLFPAEEAPGGVREGLPPPGRGLPPGCRRRCPRPPTALAPFCCAALCLSRLWPVAVRNSGPPGAGGGRRPARAPYFSPLDFLVGFDLFLSTAGIGPTHLLGVGLGRAVPAPLSRRPPSPLPRLRPHPTPLPLLVAVRRQSPPPEPSSPSSLRRPSPSGSYPSSSATASTPPPASPGLPLRGVFEWYITASEGGSCNH